MWGHIGTKAHQVMVPTTDTVRSAFLLQTLAGTLSDDGRDGWDDHGRGVPLKSLKYQMKSDMITIWSLYDHYMITIIYHYMICISQKTNHYMMKSDIIW